MRMRVMVVGAIVLAAGTPASGQCQIANPSFELASPTANVFGGWSQYGAVRGSVLLAVHGSASARIDVPSAIGDSGVFQRLDTNAGEGWEGGVTVTLPSSLALGGSAYAEVRIEWLNSGGGVISTVVFPAADPSTPTDAPVFVPIVTGPAPSGSVDLNLVLAVGKTTSVGSGRAHFDLVSLDSTMPPTIAERQFNEFPSGRMIRFAGFDWHVKGDGFYGPGPNSYESDSNSVWIDANGLHMTIKNRGGTWYSTEIMTANPIRYGDHRLTTRGDLDLLDEGTVFGLATWEYPECWDPANPWNLHNEFDIEVSRWGDPDNPNQAQFVAQPFDYPGNLEAFPLEYIGPDDVVTHALRWLPDRVEGRIWRGGANDEATSPLLRSWTYTGPHVPREGLTRYHITLWHVAPPGSVQEVVIEDFVFDALGPATGGCCESSVCTIATEEDCATIGGIYNGDGTGCGPDTCPPAGVIELRLVTPLPDLDGSDITLGDLGAGVDLYVQARIAGDALATGLVTFDCKLIDGLSGVFEAQSLTILEATGLDLPGDDIDGRTGMFPSYRGTIGSNNNDPANGEPFGDRWAFLPLNVEFGGNGEGINGSWSSVYKFNWSSADTTPRTVVLDVSASFGGYQSLSGLVQPTPVTGDTLTLTIAPACPCEFDGIAGVDAIDLLAFLGLWFPMDPGADYDGSGVVSVVDLLEFLSCWFRVSSGSPCS